jgi:Uma2 family endonuclease
LSPATIRHDRNVKHKIYARAGVGTVWHLDPVARLLEVFERRDSNWLLVGTFKDDDKVSAPPFTELTFDLSVLWPYDKVDQT